MQKARTVAEYVYMHDLRCFAVWFAVIYGDLRCLGRPYYKDTNVISMIFRFNFTTARACSLQSSAMNFDILKQVLNRQNGAVVGCDQSNISTQLHNTIDTSQKRKQHLKMELRKWIKTVNGVKLNLRWKLERSRPTVSK